MGQMLRAILEAACPLFAQRLRFYRCEIHNVVGNADLGYPIDLQAMSEAAPACCKWFPELFPGLECRIWLTESYTCVCGKMGTKKGKDSYDTIMLPGAGSHRKCSCVVKLLIFKTGCLVITGARRLADVNAVFFRIKSLLGEFKSNGINKQFYKQLGSMLTPASDKAPRKDLKPDVAVACILSGINPMTSKPAVAATPAAAAAAAAAAGETLPPFMQVSLAGRTDVVKMLFLMDPGAADERDAAGRNTLERMLQIPIGERTAEQKGIIEMLTEVRK
jgi:hypothetical protein